MTRGRSARCATHPTGRPLVAWHGSRGFTMVELLTVMAIIGILATLLMSALSTAKRKSRVAVCTSNLRQIALGFTMYQDDYGQRPKTWDTLLRSGNLGDAQLLQCPEDRSGNWGNQVQPDMTGNVATNRHSYLYPMPWDDWAWNRIVKSGAHAGLAACQLHGIGRPDPALPSMRDYEGLVLRAQLDGAVVRREIYWQDAPEPAGMPEEGADASFSDAGVPAPTNSRNQFTGDFPWALFMDEPLQP